MAKKSCIFQTMMVLALLLKQCPILAQGEPSGSKKPLVVSIFNLGTQLPGKLWTAPVHPGVSAGTEFKYNQSTRNQLFQTAKLAVSYHKYVQTSIQLFSEAGFRKEIWRGAQAEFRLGAGYLHAIAATEIFEAKNGVYHKKANLGRPQFMASTAFGLSYQVQNRQNAPRVFIDYQFFVQMPFVRNYVPLAPNTALHLGAAIPVFNW